METHLGSESVKSVLENQFLQDGNSGGDLVILTDRGMGNLTGLQRCVFPYPNQPKVKEVSEILHEQPNFPFYCATIAYHVGLNALLVAARNYDQRLRKKDIYSWP